MLLSDLTPSQLNVYNEVRNRLKDKLWFRGVDLTRFPSDKDCTEHFDQMVDGVEKEVRDWDAPDPL